MGAYQFYGGNLGRDKEEHGKLLIKKEVNKINGVMMLWTEKLPLVILSLFLPVLIVPLISILLYPEIPLTTSILAGAIFSLFVAIGLRFIQGAKAFGARFVIAIIVIAVVIGLLMGLLPKLLP